MIWTPFLFYIYLYLPQGPISTITKYMKKGLLAFVLLAAGIAAAAQTAEELAEWDGQECTSIFAGRLATTDGSVITSHTCDGVSHTWVSLEQAADHPAGSMHKIYKGMRWTKFKGDTTGVKCVGEIPQAPHTYAYIDTGYPCMNEKQVAIGESTFTGPDTLINKESMFMIEELARIALMRCDNARAAIRMMGAYAEVYGYGDGGEALTVSDKNEVWLFEICGVGKHKTGAVWAAQRIPDDEVAIVANIPRVGKVDRANPDFYMCSDNVESVAIENGLWDGQGDCVFWKIYNVPRAKGHNYSIRDWFVLNALAPSLGLTMDMEELPLSVKPEKGKISVNEVMAFLRGTYEGTDADMCKNWLIEVPEKDGKPAYKKISPQANPWLTATTRNTLNTIAPGTIDFVRTLAVAWCSYSTVLQSRNWLPDEIGGILWYGVDNPGQSPRIPIFAGGKTLPHAFDFCGQKQYKADCILWQFRRANRLGTLEWQTHKDTFEKKILEIEKLGFEGLPQLEADFATTNDAAGKAALLDAYTAKIHEAAAATWQKLEEDLWHKHGRGF